MGKFSIKNIIIALIIALSLIGTTVFVCVVVLGNDDSGEVGDGNEGENDEGGEEETGDIDNDGWTTPDWSK